MKKILVIISVVLLLVVGVSGCTGTTQEEGPGGISIPSDYEKTTTNQVEEDVTMTQYLVQTDDSSDVINDLKQSAMDAGWEVMSEWKETVAGYDVGVALEKGDEAMAISTMDADGETMAIIITGPKDTTNGGDDGTDPSDEDELTGTVTYSGSWSGETEEMGDISGTWEFEVDFDAGTVSGWFDGDTSGDISGSVSNGMIEAEGEAALGTVTWSGSFTSDGSQVSGDWEFAEGIGSGTWEGTEGEADQQPDDQQDDQEESLPSGDQVSGDEPVERYPGSVMLSHSVVTYDGEDHVNIEYGTADSVEDVADWYKEKLGAPTVEQTEDGEKQLSWASLEEGQGVAGYTVLYLESNGYTTIEIQMGDVNLE